MKVCLFLLLTFVLLHAALATKYDDDCYSKCTKKRWKLKKSCSKKYCKIKKCKKKHGKKATYKCVPKKVKKKKPDYYPDPDPYPVKPYCENKCYLKWKKAKKGCSYKYCKVSHCKYYYKGEYYAGYKCGYLAYPSASPSPKPYYPPSYCANKCMYKWKDARYGCSPLYCNVVYCKLYYGGQYYHAWKCANKVLPSSSPTPSISPTPSATPSVSPSPKPLVAVCANKCYLKWVDAKNGCSPFHCGIKYCKLYYGGKYYNGYKCADKAYPVVPPAPPAAPLCDDYCYPKWKLWKVKKTCNPYYCKVAGCYYKKYVKKTGYYQNKYGYNCVKK